MINHSRSISHIPFHSCAPAPHGIIRPILLLLLLAPAPSATAQTATNSSSHDVSNSNFNPVMGMVIVVLIFSFLFMGFLSLYIRYCDKDAESENFSRAAAARLQLTKGGLDTEVIDSFPIFHYSEVKDLRFGRGGALECAVCLAEFENDNSLRLLTKCDHVFHPECIDAWLASHSTCPVCRANLARSQDELAEGTELTHSINSAGLGEAQNQIHVSIDIDEIPNREVQASEMPKRNRRGGGKFPRSHSTGHSLIQSGENFEIYTLRLPVEARGQLISRTMKRTISCVVILPVDGSSRRK